MALITPDEISSIIKSKIENYDIQTEVANTGRVIELGDGIARIYGLRNVMSNELVVFEDGKNTLGITLNLDEDNVGVVILGDYTKIKEGMSVKSTGKIASVPVGDALIGRIIDPTGVPIDGKGDIHTDKTRPIERIAPGIIERKSVYVGAPNAPKPTYISAIDRVYTLRKYKIAFEAPNQKYVILNPAPRAVSKADGATLMALYNNDDLIPSVKVCGLKWFVENIFDK